MKKIKVNDIIKISGGYDNDPPFLKDPPNKERIGKVIKFIPGQNEEKAAVIKLDSPITATGVTGDILILELRYVGQTWKTEGPVHIELCDFTPEEKQWQQRKQGAWIESHASLKIIKS
ncbi:MAG: hypothetical protein NTW65_08530 [Deltaproteobacteria bacterium]|nr:hypothetical protein [Deltaproteobacteria bacterium]